jgi:multidrug efflux pump
MTIGTLFTLFVVPSVYVLIAKDHRKEKAKREALENSPDDPTAVGPPAYGVE